jgi:co-chaperonin GroES (HSP10)
MAAGPGRTHPETGIQLECAVAAGESVIYGKYDGTEMKYNDVNHQLIKDDDVLLKYTGNDLTFANCEPVKDQIMIRLNAKENTSASGIIVNAVDSKDVRIDSGVVAKVGPGRQAGNGATMPVQVSALCSVCLSLRQCVVLCRDSHGCNADARMIVIEVVMLSILSCGEIDESISNDEQHIVSFLLTRSQMLLVLSCLFNSLDISYHCRASLLCVYYKERRPISKIFA